MARCYVNVRFKSDYGTNSKLYVYVAEGSVEDNKDFKQVIVDSPSTGYTLVDIDNVADLDESSYNGSYKYVVQFVDDREYKQRKEKEKRRAAIEKELRRMHEEREKNKKLEELVSDMPEAKALIDELKSL